MKPITIIKQERKALREGREIQRLYERIESLLDNLISIRQFGDPDKVLIDSQKDFRKFYNQIIEIEKKYFNSHIELAQTNEKFNEAHKEACYKVARLKIWGEDKWR